MSSASSSSTDDVDIDEIVSSKKRAQLVVAAAGSGKTHVLVNCVAERIRRSLVNPESESIVVFTFTNNAADELFVRLTRLLDEYGLADAMNHIFIGTIHGWCNEFVNKSGALSNTKIVDELEQVQMIQRIYPILKLEELYEGRNKFDRIEKFLHDLEFFFNEGLSLDDPIVPENVRVAVQNYLTFLRSQRLMDFGSVIKQALEIINKRQLERPTHLFVDEYQDVNPAQVKLFQAIIASNARSRILAVGDPRQSIYQWRGGDVRRLVSFDSEFPQAVLYPLSTNRRSRPGIIHFANAVAGDMDFGRGFKLKGMRPSQERKDKQLSVVRDTVSTPHESSVVDLIQWLIGNGTKPGDIAVLYRSVLNHADSLMNDLDSTEIKYYCPNRNRGTFFISDFMAAVIHLVEVAHLRPEPANRQEEEEMEESIMRNLQAIASFATQKDTRTIHAEIGRWHSRMHADGNRAENECYNLREQFFDFCQKIGFRINPEEIELQEGFSATTQIMKSIEEAYRRRFLAGYHIRSTPCDVFLHNLKWELGQQIERWTETGMDLFQKDRVTISTVHAAKGLEWPVVILPLALKNLFPLPKSGHKTSFSDEAAGRYGTTIEDEKRLWYVAATRARDRLYIFAAGDGKHKPSPFIYENELGERDGVFTGSWNATDNESLSRVEQHSRAFYAHIGVSDLLLLLECRYQFFLRRIAGVQVPVGEQLGAGNIIHKVVQRLADGAQPYQLDEILKQEIYLPLAEVELERRVRWSIRSKVKSLIDSQVLDSIDSTEYKFGITLGSMIVTGIVDATRTLGSSLEIVDWKYNVHDKFIARYSDQLAVYAFALRALGKNVSRAILYDLGTVDNDSHAHETEVDVSANIADSLIQRASDSFDILSRQPPDTQPSQTACSLCDVRRICPDALEIPS